MKFKLGRDEYQIRVQQRQVVSADVLHHGEVVARGEAILNPLDENDQFKANNIAVGRALKQLPGEDRGKVQKEIVRRLPYRTQPSLGLIEAWNEGWDAAVMVLGLQEPQDEPKDLGGIHVAEEAQQPHLEPARPQGRANYGALSYAIKTAIQEFLKA